MSRIKNLPQLYFSMEDLSIFYKKIPPNSNSLFLLADLSIFYKKIPRNFTITTKTGSSKFNIDLLVETSMTISNFVKGTHHEFTFHLDIEDPRNVLGKFEQLYQGQPVYFDQEDLPTSYEITKKLLIIYCPNYLKPENLHVLENDYRRLFDIDDLSYGVMMFGLIQFLKNLEFQTFTIITNNNKYNCNIYGVYFSDIICKQIEEDPTKKEYVYNFDDENNEFQLICKLFNFEKIEITNENFELLKEIINDLQIECLYKSINKFEKVTQTIDDQQKSIDSINELFEWLYSIKEKTVKTVLKLIIESPWVKTDENVKEFVAFFIEVAKTDFLLNPYLVDLMNELNNQSQEFPHLKMLIPFIVQKLLHFLDDEDEIKSNYSNCIYAFIYKLIKKGIISISQIQNKFKYYKLNDININNWLLPILLKNDQSNYFNDMMVRNAKNKSSLKIINQYYPDKIDLYEQILNSGEPIDLIAKALRNDDIDTFQSIIVNQSIDVNQMKIKYNPFDSFIMYRDMNYLNYAAAFGSLKCFKYLLLNYIEIDDGTFEFAIFGGNDEIINIVDKKRKQSDYFGTSLIEYCIKKHRNDLFDWILEKDIKNKYKHYISELIKISANNGNAHSLTEMIYRGFDVSKNDDDDYDDNSNIESLFEEAIKITANNGFYKLTKILYKIIKEKEINVYIYFMLPVRYGNLSIFKLLSNEVEKNTYYKNWLLHAIKNNYISIVKYMIEEMNVKLKDDAMEYFKCSIQHKDVQIFDYLTKSFNQMKILNIMIMMIY